AGDRAHPAEYRREQLVTTAEWSPEQECDRGYEQCEPAGDVSHPVRDLFGPRLEAVRFRFRDRVDDVVVEWWWRVLVAFAQLQQFAVHDAERGQCPARVECGIAEFRQCPAAVSYPAVRTGLARHLQHHR